MVSLKTSVEILDKVRVIPPTVKVTTRGYRSYNSPLIRRPFKDSYWVGE